MYAPRTSSDANPATIACEVGSRIARLLAAPSRRARHAPLWFASLLALATLATMGAAANIFDAPQPEPPVQSLPAASPDKETEKPEVGEKDKEEEKPEAGERKTKLSTEELADMKTHGVTPEYLGELGMDTRARRKAQKQQQR